MTHGFGRFSRHLALALIAGMGLSSVTASAQQHKTPRVVAGLRAVESSSRPEGRRHTKEEVARWNDRSTPRRMLETFFFAIYAYDLAPELIVNAIGCLDLSAYGKRLSEGDAALMAHELNSILSRSDVALYGLPDDPKQTSPTWTLASDNNLRIELIKQDDGFWQFDAETVLNISKMRSLTYRSQRATQEARMKLAEGRTDPESSMRSFLSEVVRHDFTSAARCLDLRDIPSKLRAARGPELARKLAFVIQRCGFVFPQEIISDPDGYRYIWHSNHRGRIMLDRVRQANGQDAWLFSRGTVWNLDALVEGFRNTPPDPRYEFVGVVVDAEMLLDDDRKPVAAPEAVPKHLESARATLLTFLEGMDELGFDDQRTRQVLSCLELSELSEDDRSTIGLRTAAKLDAVLRHLNVDVLSVPVTWEAEPQFFGKEQELQVVLTRHPDGAWRFDADTVARASDMFDSLPHEKKNRTDRASHFGSARQAVRTLLQATSRGDSALAARTLDLSSIPFRAQAGVGPVLAHKLKFLLNQTGPIQIQEIPNEIEGPRFVLYRGPLGRISLEPMAIGPRKGEWLFTAETVAQIEPMFMTALSRATASSNGTPRALGDPLNFATIGLFLRDRLPTRLQTPLLGLEYYQWIGLVLIVGVTLLFVRMGSWLASRGAFPLLKHEGSTLGAEFIQAKLKPLAFLLALWTSSVQLTLLDLPVAFWSMSLPLIELAWTVLLGWSVLRLIDLAMAFYTNSESLQHRRNLSDMIVPTAVRFLKLSVLVVAISWIVYLIGSGEWVTRLLAGLGLVGLAASLAAQDTLKNFFGTLLLIGEHPFKIGDHIVVNGMEGSVESVGFRSTWLRTADDSLITIPNSIIANASIDNRGARSLRRYRTMVSIESDTPSECLIAFRDGLREYARNHPLVLPEKIDIYIHSLNNNGDVDLLVNLYFKVQTSRQEQEARDELNRTILEYARSANVVLATSWRSHAAAVASPSAAGSARPNWVSGHLRSDGPQSGISRPGRSH